ncbi:hypothetical protein Noda2021_01860 [Candidatus Dependentiae bacterium Noda2021]|nr:hypothetical protein Noda2021_01860 [Candidatus Dependentiae bacterium Noda2021]
MISSTTSSRSILVFFSFFLLYILIIANLYVIQIVKGSYYAQLGEKQYHIKVTTNAIRGDILDRNGKPLAINSQSWSAFILPNKVTQKVPLTNFLKTHFPDAYKKISKKQHSSFMYIKRKLTPAEIELIETHNLPDIKILQEPNRYYPNPSAATLVGVTDVDNAGVLGIEFTYNDHLAGKPSQYLLERDARSGRFYFSRETHEQGLQGKSLMLTIDSDLQFLVQEELVETLELLAAKSAAAIVLDPASGEIIALNTAPSFDPEDRIHLNTQATKNIVIQDAYELGSVIKVFAAMAALEEGVVTPDELIDCRNSATAVIEGGE